MEKTNILKYFASEKGSGLLTLLLCPPYVPLCRAKECISDMCSIDNAWHKSDKLLGFVALYMAIIDELDDARKVKFDTDMYDVMKYGLNVDLPNFSVDSALLMLTYANSVLGVGLNQLEYALYAHALQPYLNDPEESLHYEYVDKSEREFLKKAALEGKFERDVFIVGRSAKDSFMQTFWSFSNHDANINETKYFIRELFDTNVDEENELKKGPVTRATTIFKTLVKHLPGGIENVKRQSNFTVDWCVDLYVNLANRMEYVYIELYRNPAFLDDLYFNFKK